jgi:hypothetical protein
VAFVRKYTYDKKVVGVFVDFSCAASNMHTLLIPLLNISKFENY